MGGRGAQEQVELVGAGMPKHLDSSLGKLNCSQ